MSDIGRKPLSDKVSEAVYPDSQKSATQNIKEGITDAYDKVARDVQPEEDKSTLQSAVDNVSGSVDDTKADADKHTASFLDSAKVQAASAQEKVADALNAASEYISGKK
ncbi:heat shock protein 9/12-domain-containing protein [Lipomyces oligophaga]|uniref:heat shock protein 9/12-domain-containing protein n=1 Tax=Lipomyces oligophaga TaxID=45792 RepID=UPI0034CD4493